MELKEYLAALRRRWLLILTLPVLVALFALYEDQTRTVQYTATARVSIEGVEDEPVPGDFEFDSYYNWLSTEFMIDDLTEIVGGSVFAENVAERMNESGAPLTADDVAGALSADRQHRILSIMATTSDHGRSVVIANAAAVELGENSAAYLGADDGSPPVLVRPVEIPLNAEADTLRMRLVLVFGILVAGGAGLLLAMLVEYLDDRLHSADAAAHAVALPHLATVRGERG